jgi:hypothetical protein
MLVNNYVCRAAPDLVRFVEHSGERSLDDVAVLALASRRGCQGRQSFLQGGLSYLCLDLI